MEIEDILTYVICFAICIIGFIAKRKKVVEEEDAEEVPAAKEVVGTHPDASYGRTNRNVASKSQLRLLSPDKRDCPPPTNGGARRGCQEGVDQSASLQEHQGASLQRTSQEKVIALEPEGESEYAIHSAEEARRAIIYSEILNRKY